jgi:hypothetical protein
LLVQSGWLRLVAVPVQQLERLPRLIEGVAYAPGREGNGALVVAFMPEQAKAPAYSADLPTWLM